MNKPKGKIAALYCSCGEEKGHRGACLTSLTAESYRPGEEIVSQELSSRQTRIKKLEQTIQHQKNLLLRLYTAFFRECLLGDAEKELAMHDVAIHLGLKKGSG